MSQVRIPAVYMRGGTSKALFFRPQDLPANPVARDQAILAAFGSPDPYRRQLNGLGGATSSTSKVAIVSRSDRLDADVEFEFGQVGIDQALVDYGGTCGNISAAVGPYAIEVGWVAAREPLTPVRVYNTNTGKVFVAHVPVAGGTFQPEGDFAIKGVPGTGSKILLEYLDPGGGVSGRLLPTGRPRDVFQAPGLGGVEVSVVDAGNPVVFCRLEALGLTGHESPSALDADSVLLERLEALRAQAAVACGLASTPEEAAKRSPAVPKVAFVSAPRSYRTTDGHMLGAEDMDVLGRIVSMGRVHTSYALTGAIATAVAAFLPGSVVHEVARPACRERGAVVVGHPAGLMDELGVEVDQVQGEWRVNKVTSTRTARRLMDGGVYVPAGLFAGLQVGRSGSEVRS